MLPVHLPHEAAIAAGEAGQHLMAFLAEFVADAVAVVLDALCRDAYLRGDAVVVVIISQQQQHLPFAAGEAMPARSVGLRRGEITHKSSNG